MRYNGCSGLLSAAGVPLYAREQGPYSVQADDGITYRSDGNLWQRDPTVSPVTPAGYGSECPQVMPAGPDTSILAAGYGSECPPDPYASFILPTDSAERKRVPLWSGLFRYFPDALVAVARLSWAGNEKHNKGQPLHWSRDKSNDHADCLLRHQMDTGTGEVDPDSKELHEVEVAWRALAQAQLALERQRQGGRR